MLRQNALEKSSTKALPEHQALAQATADCQAAVNRAFNDSIDTVSVMESILGEPCLPPCCPIPCVTVVCGKDCWALTFFLLTAAFVPPRHKLRDRVVFHQLRRA